MRQVRKNTSGNEVRGGFPKEGIVEGLARGAKFSKEEIVYIRKRRAELILEGRKDGQMGGVLALEMKDRPADSIITKIRGLVRIGEFEKNPNKTEKRAFEEEELAYIKSRTQELSLEGHMDRRIARILAGEMDRTEDSIREKIVGLFKGGELPENPNKKKMQHFSEEDIAYIVKRRAELVLEGKLDGTIARVLGLEMDRNHSSIAGKMRELVECGRLEINPDRKSDFSKEEVAHIKKRRAELILEGKKDNTLAGILALEMGRLASSIRGKIYDLVGSGELLENPHKQNEFSEKEIAHIKKRRAELILEGKKDREITRIVAGEINRRSDRSVGHKLQHLIESGEIEENPHKQNDFSEAEVAFIIKRRAELILEGGRDHGIAGILAGEMNRIQSCVLQKIRELVENGSLAENPNKQGRKFSDEELAAELSAAVDMYLGDSP